MPATSEDALSSSDDELDNDDQLSPGEEDEGVGGGGGRRNKRGSTSSTTLIDRVVLEKREKFQPSLYAQTYGDDEGNEEWTHLLPRDHRDDDLTISTGPVSGGSFFL